MGRGKRPVATRAESVGVQLGSSNGRTRLVPVVRAPEPLFSADIERLLATALAEALEGKIEKEDLDRIWDIFADTGGDDEARVQATAAIFTGELLEIEEETEQCDRCDKIVRAGHGRFYPEDDPDQERLCMSCFAAAAVGP